MFYAINKFYKDGGNLFHYKIIGLKVEALILFNIVDNNFYQILLSLSDFLENFKG